MKAAQSINSFRKRLVVLHPCGFCDAQARQTLRIKRLAEIAAFIDVALGHDFRRAFNLKSSLLPCHEVSSMHLRRYAEYSLLPIACADRATDSGINKAFPEGNFLQAGNLYSLAMLNGSDKG